MIQEQARAMPRIEDYRDKNYDPYTAALTLGGEGHITDLYPELKRMRQQAPIWAVDFREHFGVVRDMTTADQPAYTVLGFDEVTHILNDAETFSNKAYEKNLAVYFGPSVTAMDAPEHTRYRKLFQRAFLPNMIAAWGRDIVPRIINGLIDDFAGNGRAELIKDYAILFPFRFTHELMGLPAEDRAIFQKFAFGQITIGFDQEHAMEAIEKLKAYLTEAVHLRREQPIGDNDFIHTIATAEVDGERLPDEVVIAFFRQLITAGADTTYHAFSILLTALLTHREQMEAVRKDRSLVPHAIDEAMRWDASTMFISRTPTREVSIAGVTMEPGAIINVVLGAANRDEKQYEDPDSFNIYRKNKRNTSFGLGPHICIGQHLARLEMGIALNAMLDRLPNLRLDPDGPPPVIRGFTLRTPDAVPVLFD